MSGRRNMIKQLSSHFVRCSQKIAFVSACNPASGTWTQRIVQHVAHTPPSYLVATGKDGALRRNHHHRATGESPQFQSYEKVKVPDDVPIAKSISYAVDHVPAVLPCPLKVLSVLLRNLSPSSTTDPVLLLDPLEESRLQIKRRSMDWTYKHAVRIVYASGYYLLFLSVHLFVIRVGRICCSRSGRMNVGWP